MQFIKPLAPSTAFFAKLESGEKLPNSLAELASSIGSGLLVVLGLGGFSKARLAVFEHTTNTYHYVDVEPLQDHVLEVIVLNGNIVCDNKECKPHLHTVIARRPGELIGGHLLEAEVHPFIELLVIDTRAPSHEAIRLLMHRFTTRFNAEPLRGE